MTASAPYRHTCFGCNEPIQGKHLRVQLSPPDRAWFMVRAHDLLCFLDWLEDEEQGPNRKLFTKAHWRDHEAVAQTG